MNDATERNLDDWEQLEAVRQSRSREAFAEIVNRHAEFVYATCRRRLRSHPRLLAQSEDVAQAVFLILWQRPPKQRQSAALSGWLYQTAIYACNNAMRSDRTRQRHEREAASQRPDFAMSVEQVDLDAAMEALPSRDRDALLLRFYEGAELNDVGAALGISQNTAAKRVSRALARLREILVRTGKDISPASIGVAITQLRHEPSMPQQLAQGIIARVCVAPGAGGGIEGTSLFTKQIAEGVLYMIRQMQLKFAAMTLAAAVVVVGGGFTTYAILRADDHTQKESAQGKTASDPAVFNKLDAATPKDAARTFAKAIRAGDIDIMRALVKIDNEDEQQLLDAACEYAKASKDFLAEVRHKFGEPPVARLAAQMQLTPLDVFAGIIEKGLDTAEISQDGDHATFTPKSGPDDALYFEKEGDIWKVSAWRNIKNWTPEQRIARRDMMLQAAASMQQLTEDVSKDKYPTVRDVFLALKAAFGQGK